MLINVLTRSQSQDTIDAVRRQFGERDQVMHMLFDPTTGDGLDFLRQPIGASDMVATSQDYTL